MNFQCFWALGACFEVTLALLVVPTMGWRWLLGFSTAPILLFIVISPVNAKNNASLKKQSKQIILIIQFL